MTRLDEITASLEPQLAELESKRAEALEHARRTRRGLLVASVIVGAVLIGIGASSGHLVVALVIGGVAWLILSGIIYAVRTSGRKKDFKRDYKAIVVRGITGALHPDLRYDQASGIPKSLFEASKLFSYRPDRYHAEDGFYGRIGETDVMFSEVHAEYESRSTDSEGRTTTSYVTFFDGLFLTADFHKDFGGRMRVLPDQAESLLGRLGKKLQAFRPFSDEKLVYVEDPVFEKHFVIYGTDQIEARYILSTSMLERIVALKQKWADEISLSFRNSMVSVAIKHKKNLFEPDLKRSALDRDQVAQFYHELTTCFALVEDLNLNTRIWSKD